MKLIEYRKAWSFVRKYKSQLIIKIIFILLFQFVAFTIPFIIQDIIDNKLLGVQNPLTEVAKSSEAIELNEKYYKFTKDLTTEKSLGSATIILVEQGFYLIEEQLDPKNLENRKIVDQKLVANNQTYPAIKLSQEQLFKFYNPIIPGLISMLALLLIMSVLEIIFTYIERMRGAKVIIEVTRDARKEAMRKLGTLPISEVEAEPAGKTANRVLNDTIGISSLYISTINVIFSMGFSLIFAYVGIAILSVKAALITLLIVPIMILWSKFFTKKLDKVVTKINETNSLLIAQINEMINGVVILKTFNSEQKKIDSFNNLNSQYIEETMEEQRMHLSAGWNGLNLFQALASGMIIIVFGYLFVSGISKVEPGVINTYYMFIIKIIAPISILFNEFSQISNHKVKINRIFRIYDGESEEQEIKDVVPFKGELEFKNINFSYDGKHQVLQAINLKIEKGQKVGLVGHTGSGKSTMMNLLLRFNDYHDGEILIDGTSIQDYSKRTYRKHVGIILQEPILFSGTLYENIAYGVNVSPEEAEKLYISVGGERFLKKYPDGINEKIDRKGGNLSLGEKQLISFARLLAYNPQVIILDEATANIDTETEKLFNYALDVIAQNKTVIIIAHRLSTIVDSDKIVVLERGKIIEEGKHQELVKLNGYYASMYRNQVTLD